MNGNGAVIRPTLDVIAEAPNSDVELHIFCEQGRRLFYKASDLLLGDAHDLRYVLSRVQGNPILLGMDSRRAARLVTNHLLKAAVAADEAAKQMKLTWFDFQRYYLNTPRHPRGRRAFAFTSRVQGATMGNGAGFGARGGGRP